MTSIGAPRVGGPNSALKTIVQTALNKEASGANSFVNRQLAKLGQTGGGDWGNLASSGGHFGINQLAGLWKSVGGPGGRTAQLMAHVAMAESGGWPLRNNGEPPPGTGPKGGDGGRHRAAGLWQILGLPFPGNVYDPRTNAKMALSKWRGAGTSPWASSRGAWGRFAARGGFVGRAKGGRAGSGQKRHHHGHPNQGAFVTVKLPPGDLSGGSGFPTTIGTGDSTQNPPGSTPFHGGPAGGRPTVSIGVVGGFGSPDNADAVDNNTNATDALTAAIQANADAQQSLADELKRQNDFAQSVTAVNGLQVTRALVDLVNGNLGPRVQQRIQSPSRGSVAIA